MGTGDYRTIILSWVQVYKMLRSIVDGEGSIENLGFDESWYEMPKAQSKAFSKQLLMQCLPYTSNV